MSRIKINKDKQINLRLTKKQKEKIKYLSREYGYKTISEYILKSSLGVVDRETNVKKINTLTLNPAIDYIINFDKDLKDESIVFFDSKNRNFKPGGKGINASIIADTFNARTQAIHCSDGFSGELLKNELSSLNIQQTQIPSEITTRINLKLNFNSKNYGLNSVSEPLPSKAKSKILNKINSFIEGEILMIMGSYHKDDGDFIKEISELCVARGVEIVYDISTPLLIDLLKYNPLIIKPNKEELESIFGKKINSEKEIITLMKKLKELGAKNVAITLGKDGSFLLDENSDLYSAKVKPIKLVSPQGSGDSFLATFIIKKSEGSSEAFKWANAAGAATAQVEGLAEYELIKNTLNNITISKD